MVQDKIIVENDRWAIYYASVLQECWRQEIDAAIEKVKREVPIIKHKLRRRKRGYWTQSGFAWFRRKRKWRNYKGHALGLRGDQKIRQ